MIIGVFLCLLELCWARFSCFLVNSRITALKINLEENTTLQEFRIVDLIWCCFSLGERSQLQMNQRSVKKEEQVRGNPRSSPNSTRPHNHMHAQQRRPREDNRETTLQGKQQENRRANQNQETGSTVKTGANEHTQPQPQPQPQQQRQRNRRRKERRNE